jgi:glycosyltransferase involved in cell wall biosynthesis
MEFFYPSEKSFFKITDKKNLTIRVKLNEIDKKLIENNDYQPEDIYFAAKNIFQLVQSTVTKLKKANVLPLVPQSAEIYSKYLAAKDIFRSKTGIPVKDQLKIAFIFDIKFLTDAAFKNYIIDGLNYFYQSLTAKYQDIQFDVFTIYLSEWFELSALIPVTNLLPLPETLDKLIRSDAYINFSEIVNKNNLIDREKIDMYLKVLGVDNSPHTPNFTLNRSDMTTDRLREKEEHNSLSSKSPLLPVPFDSVQGPDVERSRNIRGELKTDLVSVIIPTYNREKFLQEAVNSVLNQTYKNLEIIIVDDGSTDNTRAVVENYLKDKRVKYFFQKNKGHSVARNTGIINATGKYIMFLDDDDYYFPYSVDKLLTFIKKQPESVKMIYGDAIYFNGQSKNYNKEPKCLPKPALYFQLLTGNIFTTPGEIIAETKAIKDIGMFDENYVKAEDYDLWNRMALKYDIMKIDIPVVFYRKHHTQSTNNMGIIRYYSDKTCFKYWNLLKEDENRLKTIAVINNLSDVNLELAANLEKQVLKMQDYIFIHYDTILEILKFALEKNYTEERKMHIRYLNNHIPVFIKEKFNSNMRISEEEKEIIRQEVLISKRNIYS